VTPLVPITLFGWIPAVLLFFMLLSPRRAIIVSFLVAWLFLPMAEYRLAGLPDYGKVMATSLGTLMGAVIFDARTLLRFRPRWIDIPMVIWCLCPLPTSVLNGLGAYDGLAGVFGKCVLWGSPYLIGRTYFNTLPALRDLAVGIMIGGLIYVPLCLYEIRMSPSLHNALYGYHQNTFSKYKRWGSYRPMTFMRTALNVVFWMTCATVVCFWLRKAAGLKTVMNVKSGYLLAALAVTVVLCKTFLAYILLPVGVVVLYSMARFKTRIVFSGLVLGVVAFVTLRATGVVTGETLVAAVEVVSSDRASSLKYRLDNETLLAEKALARPFFGWGGSGRAQIVDEQGKVLSRWDGMWIISLAKNGLVGMFAWALVFAVPLLSFGSRIRPAAWGHPSVAPAAALATIALLSMINNVPNHAANPIITIVLGGIAAVSRGRRVRPRPGAARDTAVPEPRAISA